MKYVDILYDHLVYFTAIWYILWPFGIFIGYLVYFFPHFGILSQNNLATLLVNTSNHVGQFYDVGINAAPI
jgi:hypothetical protein